MSQPIPTTSMHQIQQLQPTNSRRREIYRYSAPETLFATALSYKKFRVAAGTLNDGPNFLANKIYIIELNDTGQELVLKSTYHHGYPPSSIKFYPNNDPCQLELLATTSNCLRIHRYHAESAKFTLECELSASKSNFSSPLTSMDWNELYPDLIGTSSIDTTCTIWNVEVGKVVGTTIQTPHVKGAVNKQLIAHEKPVHDIVFTQLGNGRDQFATAGFDGSIRLFDLRQLQHSTILYEDAEKRPLNRLCWNKIEPSKLATISDESSKVVILDIRMPCQPTAVLGNHKASINGIVWAPHSSHHICSAGSDKQALIWELSQFNIEEPILAYTAESEIRQVNWANNFPQWICITFINNIEILRV